MPRARVTEWYVYEDGAYVIVDHLVGLDGEPIVQADISTITYKLYDKTAGAVVSGHDNASLTVSAVIFDALQEDAIWTDVAPTDTEGYNFRHALPGSSVATGDHKYEYVATLTTTAGDVIKVPRILNAIGFSGS